MTLDKSKSALSKLFELGAFPDDAFYIHKAFKDRDIIVYGAGESFHYFKEVAIIQYGYIPSVILDRKFKDEDTFEGIPAFSPLNYKPSPEEKEKGLVVICLGKQSYFNEVVQTLRDMGFQNIISLLDIYEVHNTFNLPIELEKKGFEYYIEQKDKIFAALEIFGDDLSREVYVKFLQTHMQRKPVALPCLTREEQYFPPDITLNKGYSRFISCGSDIHDINKLMRKVGGKLDAFVCIEPDQTIFKGTEKTQGLYQFLWEHKEQLAKNITAFPCAAYSRNCYMPFTSANRKELKREIPTGFGSRILEGGETQTQCVTLDSILPGFNPSFICVDAEGAEPEILKGAERLIRESLPDLGICVYHAPNQLWEIPLYLKSLEINYRLYLRNYTSLTGETILYATI